MDTAATRRRRRRAHTPGAPLPSNGAEDAADPGKVGQSEDRAIYEDGAATTIDSSGDLSEDMLQSVVQLAEELQQVELAAVKLKDGATGLDDCCATTIDGNWDLSEDIMQSAVHLEEELQQVDLAVVKLKDQLNREEHLQQNMKPNDKNRELNTQKVDHQRVCAGPDMTREQIKELPTVRRECDNSQAKRAQHLKQIHPQVKESQGNSTSAAPVPSSLLGIGGSASAALPLASSNSDAPQIGSFQSHSTIQPNLHRANQQEVQNDLQPAAINEKQQQNTASVLVESTHTVMKTSQVVELNVAEHAVYDKQQKAFKEQDSPSNVNNHAGLVSHQEQNIEPKRKSRERPPPPPPEVKPDKGKYLHCPIQMSEEDVPVHEIDIYASGQQFLDSLRILKEREIKLSPMIVNLPGCNLHVTPLGVPYPEDEPKPSGDDYSSSEEELSGDTPKEGLKVKEEPSVETKKKNKAKGQKGKGKAKGQKGKGTGKGEGGSTKKGKKKGRKGQSEKEKEKKVICSVHIVRLSCSHIPEYEVDLLMNDVTMYFSGFRRRLKEVNEQGRQAGFELGPGPWFIFKNELKILPEFIRANSIEIDMDSGYGDLTLLRPGGSLSFLKGIFRQLLFFQITQEVTTSFKIAMFSIMAIFCEVRRSLEMQIEILKRIEGRLKPSLSSLLQKTIHSWASFTDVVLKALAEGTLSPQLQTHLTGLLAKFRTIVDLIGESGELLIGKLKTRHLTMTGFELQAEEEKARNPHHVPHFGFPEPEPRAAPVVVAVEI